MKRKRLATSIIEQSGISISGVLSGRLISIDENGQFLIDFQGNPNGPISARLTSSVWEKLRKGHLEGREVLLAFDNNDLSRPVIIDTMYNIIEEIVESSVTLETQTAKDQNIANKRVSIDAEEDIVLQCGKASITLTKAGKILIQGEYVLSNSKGANKIKGGSIHLN